MRYWIGLATAIVACSSVDARADISLSVNVPGYTDIYLAGMPAGTVAAFVDVAPTNSPVLATSGALGGIAFTFAVTGSTNNEGDPPFDAPDGSVFWNHTTGAEHGISDIRAPMNSLVGLFLDDNQPDLTPTLSGLNFDFVGGLGLNFLSLSPGLKQPFFIGDGSTSGAITQQFIAPSGATRLFLASWDAHNSLNNSGAFNVDINYVPSPPVAAFAAAGLLFASRRRRS